MSLLLEASDNSADNVRLTTATAVAVAESIEELCGIATEIKWVNDIYLGGKKICGILCESFTSSLGKRYAVVGIGLNLCTSDFPEELRDKASSLCLEEDMRADFAARITDTLLRFWNDISSPEIIEYYRKHSAVLGKRVAFTEDGKEHLGIAETIDEYGRLTVLVDGGERRVLSSGEISLRRTDD
jgi:BirA family biotin operon repressor/biotin-[acetyl-CoA-carboxylase] ligase